MEITTADTNEDRAAVRNFLAQYINGIAPDAVPTLQNDDLYRPLVPMIRDDSGEIRAAALTCRSQFAAGAASFARLGGAMPPPARQYLPVLDKHSELDLLAVRPSDRGNGLGAELLGWMEARLRSLGVRVWFGNVTRSLAIQDLRRFYTKHGFRTTDLDESLPPLLGRNWMPPHSEQPAFYFFKSLGSQTP